MMGNLHEISVVSPDTLRANKVEMQILSVIIDAMLCDTDCLYLCMHLLLFRNFILMHMHYLVCHGSCKKGL